MISFDSSETSSWNLLFAFVWDNAKTFAWRQSLNNFPIFVPNLEIQEENKYDYSSDISTANIPKQVLYICVQNLKLNNGLQEAILAYFVSKVLGSFPRKRNKISNVISNRSNKI